MPAGSEFDRCRTNPPGVAQTNPLHQLVAKVTVTFAGPNRLIGIKSVAKMASNRIVVSLFVLSSLIPNRNNHPRQHIVQPLDLRIRKLNQP